MREMYPQSIPYLVPRTPDLMYDSLNAGECEVMLAYKQDFDSSKLREDYNPTCTLEWEGRKVKSLKDGFATKLDPGVNGTDLVNEVFGYYMKKMEDDGFLEEKWREHTEYYATPGHCDTSSNGADSESAGNTNRYLKSSGGDGGGVSVAASAASGAESDEEYGALSLKQMAGTMMFQIVGSAIAIVIALLSRFEQKKNVKRQVRRRSKRDMNSENAHSTSFDTSVQVQLDKLQSSQKELAQQMNTMMKMMQEKFDDNEQSEQTNPSSTPQNQ